MSECVNYGNQEQGTNLEFVHQPLVIPYINTCPLIDEAARHTSLKFYFCSNKHYYDTLLMFYPFLISL